MDAEEGRGIDLADFDERIIAWVEARLANGEPAFVNALGVAMGDALREVKRATRSSFTRYLEDRLGERYRIVRLKRNTDALWPRDRAPEAVVGKGVAVRPTGRRPRYASAFWTAFVEPVEAGRRRFYVPGSATIREVERPAGQDWVEIGPDVVRPSHGSRAPEANHARIEAWLAATGVDPSPVIEGFEARPRSGGSLLDLLVAALTPAQLRAVTLPLDVVAQLAKRRP